MHQRDFATPIAGPLTTYAELAATIERMAEVVRRLELRMKLTAAIENATEVGLAAEALRQAVSGAPNSNELSPNPEVGCGELTEVFSPQNGITSAPTIADMSAACFEPAPSEAKPIRHEVKVGSGESAIAASILNLYDRSGSFIKP